MESVAPVINSVVTSLMTYITKELGYWFSSRKNVEAMSKELAQLDEAAKRIVKQKEEYYDVKGLQLPPHVLTWLQHVDTIKDEAASVQTDGIGIGCLSIKKRYKAGKQSYGILEKMSQVKDIPHVESAGETILARVPSKDQASVSGTADDGNQKSVETRDQIMEKAKGCLEPKNSETQMIALCGMGGVGKSHMMERLKKHVEDTHMFDWVVKVVVGQNAGLIALQHALAEKTGGALTETTSDARAERLKNRFAAMSKDGEKKILVILDDVWEVMDLKYIGLSSSPLPNGFKLLITSRYANVCTQMGVDSDSVFGIGALNDDDAKQLFFETMGVSNDDDCHEIAEKIIKRCGNLPIALKTIASTLKGKKNKESAWNEALSCLQHHDLKDHYGTVHKVFEISYNYLKRKDEKALFLLSGVFPDDFDIPIEELIRYGWGLKLFSKVSTLAQARLRVASCVDNLISANLLAESDRVGCVIMHDLARSFVLSNSTEIKQASIVNHDDISEKLTEDANEPYQRVLIKFTDISEFPKDFKCPNLTFLKLMGGVEQLNFPNDFYKNLKKLEVLSYEEMVYPPLPPRLNQSSTHIRTLCLHGCKLISDWSAIGDLDRLEVLCFANSQVKKLPTIIGKLKKLKLLDLNGCLDLHIDDGVFRNLDKLQELYMRVSGQKGIMFTDANCDELEELSMKLSTLEVEFINNQAKPKNIPFKNLERFKISIGCLLEEDKDIYAFQNTLKLVADSSDLIDCKINNLFKKTEKLHLEVKGMKHLNDVSMYPPHESFSRLRVLVICRCIDLRYLFTVSMAIGLRKLERLEVSACGSLESLIHGDENESDGVIVFQELKFLSLDGLPKLGSFCDIDKVVELPQLVELKVYSLPNFTRMQHFFNKEIENVSMQHPFSSLRILNVYGCESLRHLFTVAMASGLRKLERLEVSYCPVMESLIHDYGDESENDGVIIFQELKFLDLQHLPMLANFCDIDKTIDLPKLAVLKLRELPNITSIYPDTAMQSLFNKQVVIPKLERLCISYMKNIKQIWPSEITSNEEVQISTVTVVEVEHCQCVVNLFPINPMPMLRNLEKLQVEYCNSIEVLFNIDLGLVGVIEEVSSSLRSICVENSTNLTEVWRIKGAINSQVGGFEGVEKIHIHGCRKFRYVFTPATANFNMNALLDTDIQDSSDYIFNKSLRSFQPNNKTTKMALCGMGSVGKNRMMEHVVKAVEDWRKFDLVVRLVIGREANTIDLQQATAEYIGEALTETAIDTRADSLRKRFMQMQQEGKKNILVILDDLWKVLDLKDIGLSSNNPLPNGFSLLIISRDQNVCTQMGVKKSSILKLGDVDEAEAKTLFFETVGISKDDDPGLYKIGEEILMICGNFLIPLKAIASVLKANIKDKSKWEEALSYLQHHNLETVNEVVNIASEMSFNNLKTNDEKKMLFLCGLFPQEFDIHVEELMRYAWGLKLFHKVDATTLTQVRHQVKASRDGLIHANLLVTNDQNGCVRMQQHAHDFVLSKCTELKQASFHVGNHMPEDESYERIVLHCKGGTSEFHVGCFNYPNLKLLKLTADEKKLVKFPRDFYERMENLEVLSCRRMVDPLLPSYSTNLRTLCLYSCSLMYDFSFLGNLINLEILTFFRCDIQKLPSTIGKLKRLKVLELTRCGHDLCIEDGIFQNLVNLEELHMTSYDESSIRLTDVNYKELATLLSQLCVLEAKLYEKKLRPKDGSFEKLEKFIISMGSKLAGYYPEMQYDSLNTLRLTTDLSELVECKICELFEKTEALLLQVKDMKNFEDVSTLHYSSFCNLRELMVSDCADLTFLFTFQVVSGLTRLEKLNVYSCPVLETLIHDDESDTSCGSVMIMFPKLKYLCLFELPCLTSLCDTKENRNRVELQQLVELQLYSLPNFTSIFPDDALMQPYQYALFNKQVQIPNLEQLHICDMEKLMQIWPSEANDNDNISKLREIEVVKCDSLLNLFPCNPLPLLNHLEKLSVDHCCSVQVLFNIDLRGIANINELTSSLRKVRVWRLENLREIWKIKGAAGGGNMNSSSPVDVIRCFQAVEEITIKKCRRFRDVFAPKSINFEIRARVIRSEDD